MTEAIIYAIGDVHGEAERLSALHEAIFTRHASRSDDRSIKIIHLGDYVDRGPDSAGVIEILRDLDKRGDAEIVNLRGNHEQMMIDAYDMGSDERLHWLMNGGDATIESYARRGFSDPPEADLDWLRNLPTLHLEADSKIAFVHAGVDPRTFPDCEERIHMWTRSPRFMDPSRWDIGGLDGWRVVHGHTPTQDFEPKVAGEPARRFNLDTGAVYGGKLSAGIFAPGEPVEFLCV